MAGYKNTTEENVLDFVLTNESPTGDGVFYLGLYLSDPTDNTEGSEVSGGSYVRQSITLVRTDQTLSNTNAITFPEATADWGTVVAFALSTAATGGTQIMYGSLSPSKTVVNGETLTIAAGQFTQTID